MSPTVTVWEVLYDAAAPGPAGDGTHIARFRGEGTARRFAAVNTCYGRPAEAIRADVPQRIAARWGLGSGQVTR